MSTPLFVLALFLSVVTVFAAYRLVRSMRGALRSRLNYERGEMSLLARKPKDPNELLKDPQTPWHVGRLMGASEMVSHLLMIRDDPELQEIGRRLSSVVEWFFTDDQVKVRPGRKDAGLTDTVVLPEKAAADARRSDRM